MKLDIEKIKERLKRLKRKEKILLVAVVLIFMQVALLLIFRRDVSDVHVQTKLEKELFELAKYKREAKIKKKEEKTRQEEFLAEFEENMKEPDFMYDPTGKKDPFRSFDFSPRKASKDSGPITELEKYSYSELKLTAIIQGFDTPKAIIEDPNGKGHTISVDSKIGRLGGKVINIDANKVSILETSIDFNGSKNTRTVELFLR